MNKIFLLVAILYLVGCTPSKKVTTTPINDDTVVVDEAETRPDNIPTENAELKPTSSVLNLPISIEIAAIEKAINTEINGLVYEDNDFNNNGGDNMKVKAWKAEDITVRLQGDTLKYYVPIKLWIQARYKVLGITDTKAVEGAIAFTFDTKYKLEENWDFVTQTAVSDYKWLKKPVIDLGVTKIPITAVVNQLLKYNKDLLAQTIDEQIQANLDMKSYMLDAWKMAQEPILLDAAYGLWLQLTPEEVMMTPLQSANGVISSTVGIKAISEIKIGEKPVVTINETLPPFKEMTEVNNNFDIHLSSEIPYTEIERLVRQEMLGETFTDGKRSVTVKSVDVFGEGDELYVGVGLDGKFKGTVFLNGKPAYNKETNSIEIVEYDYSLKTKNALYKSGGWILKSAIKKRIAPYMTYSLGNDMAEARKMIEESLNNYKVMEGILLNGHLNTMDIEDIVVTEKGLVAKISASGDLDLKIDGLSY